MKKYKIKTVPTKRGAFIRRRIDKSRSRAELVGMIYLFSIILLAALSCKALLSSTFVAGGIKGSINAIVTLKRSTIAERLVLINAGLYLLTLAVLFINCLRAVTHLKNLFKKKVSRVYGLNANIDAMESLGHIFSSSLACLVINHLIIFTICGTDAKLTPFGIVVVGLACVVHFICGFAGGKVSVFYIDEDSGVSESKRPYGRIIPLIRNVLQIAAVAVLAYIVIQYNTVHSALVVALGGSRGLLLANMMGLIPVFLQILIVIWGIVLVAHAVSPKEYSVEGPYTPGIRNFRTFSFLMCLTALADFACKYFLGEALFTQLENGTYSVEIVKAMDMNLLIIAGVSFAMVLVDCIVKLRWTKEAREEAEEGELPVPNVDIKMPNISVNVPQQKFPPINVHVPKQEFPALPPINVHVPKQAPTVNVHVPQPQMAPISVHVPQQKLPPINVHVPQQQPVTLPPINVHVPKQPSQILVNVPKQSTPIQVNVPQQKIMPAPINVHIPQQQAAPINVHVPQQKVTTPINVHIPQQMAPVSVNMPKQQAAMPPINIQMPQQQPTVVPPIHVHVPKQDPVVLPPINIQVPQQQAAPIQVNVPKQMATVHVSVPKQDPTPINVHMPQQKAVPTPISVHVPQPQMAPIQVHVPQQAATPTPINVHVPQQPANVNVHVPKQAPVVLPPINVNVPKQEASTPINVHVPAQQPANISVNVPKQEPVVLPPISVNVPKQTTPINVHVPQQAAPINVHVPQQQAAPTAIQVNVPKQEPAVLPPISVNVPKQPTNINVQVPEQKVMAPINVHVPKQEAAPIQVNVPQPQVNPAPIQVNVPKQDVAPINVSVPKQDPTPIQVNVPKQNAATPINVHVPKQRAAEVTPINVHVPKQDATPINVNVPASAAPISVNVPKQEPTSINVQMPEQKPAFIPPFSLLHLDNGIVDEPAPKQTAQPEVYPIASSAGAPALPPVNVQVLSANGEEQKDVNVDVTAQQAPSATPSQIPPINIQVHMPSIVMPKHEEPKVDVGPIVPVVAPAPVVDEPDEEPEIEKEPRDWEVRCPVCSKGLKVSDKSSYHRCPSCNKVFELRKESREVEDEE